MEGIAELISSLVHGGENADIRTILSLAAVCIAIFSAVGRWRQQLGSEHEQVIYLRTENLRLQTVNAELIKAVARVDARIAKEAREVSGALRAMAEEVSKNRDDQMAMHRDNSERDNEIIEKMTMVINALYKVRE